MTIHYTQTVEDYMAQERRKTPDSTRIHRTEIISSVSFGMVAGDIASRFLKNAFLGDRPWLQWLLLSLILTVVWHFAVKRFAWYMTRSTYRSSLKLQGSTELEVTVDGLIQHRNGQERKTHWDKVGTVTADGEYTFIDTADNFTYIIPHTRLQPGDYALFMQELARGMEAHTLAPLKALTAGEMPSLEVTVAGGLR